jgi:membrane-associated protease RseP (regulator of RpoE activity)
MGNGFHLNGHPPEPPAVRIPVRTLPPPRRRLRLPLLLFLLTVISTLFVGLHLRQAYERNQPPFSDAIYSVEIFQQLGKDPWLLLQGWPFAATLMGILLAHELGHYFACRFYGITASYPYFIPAPTLIGTMGAFIRIESPIVNRRALFDVGISGPLVGFALAVPTLAVGIAYSKVYPGALEESVIVFGDPPLFWLFAKLFWPGVSTDHLMLHPVAFAAWVGLFATALNLLPVGQLDGGHIIYALAARSHRTLSPLFLVVLVTAGLFGMRYPETIWPGWLFWGSVLLLIGMRHPAVIDAAEPLDRRRRWVAFIGLIVFLLCFTPVPFHVE